MQTQALVSEQIAPRPQITLTTSTLPPSSSWNSLRQVLSVLYTQSSRSSSAAMSEDVAMGRGHAACVDCVMLNHNGGGDCCLMRKGKSRGVRSPHTVLTKSAPANQLCIHCEKKKKLGSLVTPNLKPKVLQLHVEPLMHGPWAQQRAGVHGRHAPTPPQRPSGKAARGPLPAPAHCLDASRVATTNRVKNTVWQSDSSPTPSYCATVRVSMIHTLMYITFT